MRLTEGAKPNTLHKPSIGEDRRRNRRYSTIRLEGTRDGHCQSDQQVSKATLGHRQSDQKVSKATLGHRQSDQQVSKATLGHRQLDQQV